MLGLCCRVRFSLAAVSGGHSLVALLGLLITVACLVLEPGLRGIRAAAVAALRLNRCGTWLLVALWHVGSSQTRDQMRVSCTTGRQILYHEATREAPGLLKFKKQFITVHQLITHQ